MREYGDSRGDSRGDRNDFDRVSTGFSLMDRIASADSVEEALNIAKSENFNLNTNGNISILKGLTKLQTSNPGIRREFYRLRSDSRFFDVVNKIRSNLDQLTDNEVQELLFIARRFDNMEISTGFNVQDFEVLRQRVKENAEAGTLTLKTAVQSYFNLSSLQFDTGYLAKYLLNKLREPQEGINPFFFTQLITAVSMKDGYISSSDFDLADECSRQLYNTLDEIDFRSKCELFLKLSKIKLCYNTPNYQSPALLYKLKNNLKDNLGKLSEGDILKVVESYLYLPPEFTTDLLNEFKSMVIITLEQNPGNLKSGFLINYLKIQNKLSRARRLETKGIINIINILLSRFNTDSIVRMNIKLVIKTIRMNKLPFEEIGDQIEKYLASSELQYIRETEMVMIEFLIFINRPVDKYVDIATKSQDPGNLSVTNYLRRVITAIKNAPNKTQYVKILETLEKHPAATDDSQLTSNFSKGLFAEFDPDNSFRMMSKISKQLLASNEQINYGQLEALLNSAMNYEAINKFLGSEELSQPIKELSTQRLINLLGMFGDLESPNSPQFYFLLRVLQLNTNNLQVRRLLQFIEKNLNELVGLSRKSNDLLGKLISHSLTLPDANHPKNMLSVFSLAYMLKQYGVENERIISVLVESYGNHLKEGKNLRMNVEIELAKLLIEKGNLPQHMALNLYDRLKLKQKNSNQKFTKSLICHILRFKKVDEAVREELETVIKNSIESLVLKLNELEPKIVISAWVELIGYPVDLIESHKQKIIDVVKDVVGNSGYRVFIDMIKALPPQKLSYNYDFYFPIVKELCQNIQDFSPRLKSFDLVKVLEVVSSANIRNPSIYNVILNEISQNFNAYRNSDLISILQSFSQVGLKQVDLFDRIFLKLFQESRQISNVQKIRILVAFYSSGYDSSIARSKIIPFAVMSENSAIYPPSTPSLISRISSPYSDSNRPAKRERSRGLREALHSIKNHRREKTEVQSYLCISNPHSETQLP